MGFHGNEEAETDSEPESRKTHLRIFKWTFKEERSLIHGAMEVGEERGERKTRGINRWSIGRTLPCKRCEEGTVKRLLLALKNSEKITDCTVK